MSKSIENKTLKAAVLKVNVKREGGNYVVYKIRKE